MQDAEDPSLFRGGPVGAVNQYGRRPITSTSGPPVEARGRFEALLCRACGFTSWYGFDAPPELGIEETRRCLECADDKPHRRYRAIEHTHGGLEPMRITRGPLGWEGYFAISICSACARVSWTGTDYAHLEDGSRGGYKLVDDRGRPCLSCAHTEALTALAYEQEGTQLPVTVSRHRLFLGLVETVAQHGHFVIRLCRPCGATEWYAAMPDSLEPGPGLTALGDPGSTGPYR
jgi:predicted nucleic-acid-binding Zn-ribbon protein